MSSDGAVSLTLSDSAVSLTLGDGAMSLTLSDGAVSLTLSDGAVFFWVKVTGWGTRSATVVSTLCSSCVTLPRGGGSSSCPRLYPTFLGILENSARSQAGTSSVAPLEHLGRGTRRGGSHRSKAGSWGSQGAPSSAVLSKAAGSPVAYAARMGCAGRSAGVPGAEPAAPRTMCTARLLAS